MSTISPGSSTEEHPSIFRDESNVPRIVGSTAKVSEIITLIQADQLTPEELRDELPHLSMDQIRAALDYYYEHRAEIDGVMEEELAFANRLATETPRTVSRSQLQARLDQCDTS